MKSWFHHSLSSHTFEYSFVFFVAESLPAPFVSWQGRPAYVSTEVFSVSPSNTSVHPGDVILGLTPFAGTGENIRPVAGKKSRSTRAEQSALGEQSGWGRRKKT